MDPFFFLLIPAGLAAVGAVVAAAERRRARNKAWRRAAEKAELTVVAQDEGGLFGGGWLHARGGRLNVRLERSRRGEDDYRTLISVDGLGHGAAALSLRPEDFGTGLRRRLLGSDVEVGAPSFDGAVFLQGQTSLALAVLDGETRRRVADLLGGSARGQQVRASMRDGVLEVWLRDRKGSVPSPKRLARALGAVLDVARRLEAPRDVAAQIAANFNDEPEMGVRRECVLVLAREFSQHPATRRTLRSALQDRSAEVRLRAAVALGEEGREALLALVANEGTEDAWAAGAVAGLAALGDRLPLAEVQAALGRALAQGRTQTARAYVEAAARPGDAAAEGLLLTLLRGDAWLAVIAARALGRVGTSAAIGPLREASASLWSGELGSVARLAIAEIQSRLTGAEPGQLSLAGGEAGALSLAGGEPGALSLAEGGPAPRQPAEEEPGWPGPGAGGGPPPTAQTA